MPSVSLSVDLLGLASLLIAFNTEAPPGNEGPCARFVANYLSDLHIDGADIEVHSFARDRSNVVATFGSGAPGLLLAGHIDVVPVKDASAWSSPPYEANIRGGRMYGRGSADMKSGLAAMLAAISSAKGRKLKRSLSLVATAGEEVGFDGLDALVREGRLKRIKARCGVVGEPTEMKVVRAHRGGLTCQVAFEGRSVVAVPVFMVMVAGPEAKPPKVPVVTFVVKVTWVPRDKTPRKRGCPGRPRWNRGRNGSRSLRPLRREP